MSLALCWNLLKRRSAAPEDHKHDYDAAVRSMSKRLPLNCIGIADEQRCRICLSQQLAPIPDVLSVMWLAGVQALP
jgi:hypothetical protein